MNRTALMTIAASAALMVASTAHAIPIVGTVVTDTTGTAPVLPTQLVDRSANGITFNGGIALEYFIPIAPNGSGTCTFGINCGVASGDNIGGAGMEMFFEFTPTDPTASYFLQLQFEDLDLIGANDPSGFLESVDIFAGDGTQIASFDNIADAGVFGDATSSQTAQLNIGMVGDPFYARLVFDANRQSGGNTPEYLVAQIDTVSAVPVPAALPMLGAALVGLGFAGRRKIKQSA